MRYGGYFILEGKAPREVSLLEYVEWNDGPPPPGKDMRRRIARTEIAPGVWVSTVFLGLDHAMPDEQGPVLFETLVIGGPLDDTMLRYRTYDEAEAGHASMVEAVEKAIHAAMDECCPS
jgi:hypothetical protein